MLTKALSTLGVRRLTFLLSLLLHAPLLALAQPSYKDVTGVRANDVLNVRLKPSTKAKITGSIPHDGRWVVDRGREKKIGSTRWVEVFYKGIRGWVNTNFLAPIPAPTGLTAPLWCKGTEPFWSLNVRKGTITYQEGDKPRRFTLRKAMTSGNRTDVHGFVARANKGKGSIIVIVSNTGKCSDGMSEIRYQFEAQAVVDGTLVSGCCNPVSTKDW